MPPVDWILPRTRPKGLYLLQIVAVVIGVAASMLAAISVHEYVRSTFISEAESAADAQVATLRDRLSISQANVAAVAGLFRASAHVDRSEFNLFAKALSSQEMLKTLQWIQRVPADARAAFVSTARAEGATDFTIKVRDAEGRFIAAPEKDVYFPVLYEIPDDLGDSLTGLDLSTMPQSLAALMRASETGQMTVTAILDAAYDDAMEPSIGLFAPAVDEKADSISVLGFASAVINMRRLVEASGLPSSPIVRITDITTPTPEVLYENPLGELYDYPEIHRELEVADRTWRISLVPAALVSPAWPGWLVFGLGILLTALAVVGMQQSAQQMLVREIGAELMQRQADLEQSERIYRGLFENTGTANCEIDYATGTILRANGKMRELLGYTAEELADRHIKDLIHRDDRPSHEDDMERLRAGTLDTSINERRFLHSDGSFIWGLVTTRLISDRFGRPRQHVKVIQDITQRKLDEQARNMLVRELAHRVRNTVQIIASLADQTAKSARNVPDYVRQFQSRLRALKTAQDMLFDVDWGRISFNRLAERTLAPFDPQSDDDDAPRILIDAPDVSLTAQQAQTLALALHELGANAVRHGALSERSGMVSVTARIDGDGEEHDTLVLDWTETGGPKVKQPRHRGFGSVMLDRLLARQYGGKTESQWEPGGYSFHAELPLDPRHTS